jgi:hypothetical protein
MTAILKHSLHQWHFDGALAAHKATPKLYQSVGIVGKLCAMRDIQQERQNFKNFLKI